MPGSHSSDEGFKTSTGSRLLAECDNDDRLGFVQKVYGILATQLTVTFGFVAMVKAMPTLNDSMASYYPLAVACMVLGFCI